MKTKFLSLKEQSDIFKAIEEGNDNAKKKLALELKRLEGRIKQLEFKIEVLNTSFNDKSFCTPNIK